MKTFIYKNNGDWHCKFSNDSGFIICKDNVTLPELYYNLGLGIALWHTQPFPILSDIKFNLDDFGVKGF